LHCALRLVVNTHASELDAKHFFDDCQHGVDEITSISHHLIERIARWLNDGVKTMKGIAAGCPSPGRTRICTTRRLRKNATAGLWQAQEADVRPAIAAC
jgi:hypothetical protein